MRAVTKSFSTVIMLCLALIVTPIVVYADGHEHHHDNDSDFIFGIYLSPDNSPYYYPYRDGYVVDNPYYYSRHYIAPAKTSVKASTIVMKAQVQLYSLGFYKGTVDGIMGPQTQNAIYKFQADKNLPQTGILDTKTLKALGVSE